MAEKGKRSEKRREKREARLREITMGDDGRYSYTGDLWKIADSEEAGSGAKQRGVLIAGLFVIALAVIGSGYIDAQNAMGTFYVVFPYIGEVSALFGLLWNAAKVLVPSEVRTYALERAKPRIPGACRILTVFALAGLLFSAIYLIRYGAGEAKTADGIAYLMLKFAAAALAEWYGRRFKAADWLKQ